MSCATKLEQLPRLELRTLGRAAATVDQELLLDAEAPKYNSVANVPAVVPSFFFRLSEQCRKLNGSRSRLCAITGGLPILPPNLAAAVLKDHNTLLVMPSLGVAERVREILLEYDLDAQLLGQSGELTGEAVQARQS